MKKTMLQRFLLSLTLASVLCLGSSALQASGYELMEMSATGQSRALAVQAKFDDPSTLLMNPAGLGYMDKGFQVSAGGMLLFTTMRYEDPTGVRPSANVERWPPNTPASFWASYTPIKGLTAAVGLAFVPYGQVFKWPKGFAGEYYLDDADLRIPMMLVGLGYSPFEWISVGAFFNTSPSSLDLSQTFTVVDDAGNPQRLTANLLGKGTGYSGGVGIQVRPFDGFYFGASYRSQMTVDFDGDVDFDVPDSVSDQSVFHDQPVETSFVTPDVFGFGVGYDFTDWLYVEYDMHYTMWSINEKLVLDFPEDQSGMLSVTAPNDWSDTFTYRLGVEITKFENWALRGGFGYDENPIPDETLTPTLPDCDRVFGGIGAQYWFDFGLNVALAWQGTWFVPREVFPEDQPDLPAPIPQSYTNFANLVTFSVGYGMDL